MRMTTLILTTAAACFSLDLHTAMPTYSYERNVDVELRTTLYKQCKEHKLSNKCHYWSFERSVVWEASKG